MLKNLITLIIVEAVAWGLHFLIVYLNTLLRDKIIDKSKSSGKASTPLSIIYIVLGFIGGVTTIMSYLAVLLWFVSNWIKVFATLTMLVAVISIIWGYASSYFAVAEIALNAKPSKVAPVVSYLIIGYLAVIIMRLAAFGFVGSFEMSDSVYHIIALVAEIIMLIVTVAFITATEIKQKELSNNHIESDDVQ